MGRHDPQSSYVSWDDHQRAKSSTHAVRQCDSELMDVAGSRMGGLVVCPKKRKGKHRTAAEAAPGESRS